MTQGQHWLEKVHAHMRDLSVVKERMIVGKLFNAMVKISEELHPVANYGQQVSSPRGHVAQRNDMCYYLLCASGSFI